MYDSKETAKGCGISSHRSDLEEAAGNRNDFGRRVCPCKAVLPYFGWHGNDHIIANTKKGQGLDYLIDKPLMHGYMPKGDENDKAFKSLK